VGNSGVTVNWQHPLSTGLIFACVPSLATADLVTVGSVALQSTLVSDWSNSTPEGPGLFCDNTATTRGPIWAGIPSVFSTWTALTIYWRAMHLGNAGTTPSWLLGVSYNNGFGSPAAIASIMFSLPGGSVNVSAAWNNAGTDEFISGGHANNVMTSWCATFVVGGNVNLYRNASLISGPTAFGASYSTLDPNRIYFQTFGVNATATVGYIWNRALSVSEISALDLDPYGLISPTLDMETPLTIVAGPTFNPAWARGKNIVIEGVAT
jgi:hypothetical protein